MAEHNIFNIFSISRKLFAELVVYFSKFGQRGLPVYVCARDKDNCRQAEYDIFRLLGLFDIETLGPGNVIHFHQANNNCFGGSWGIVPANYFLINRIV